MRMGWTLLFTTVLFAQAQQPTLVDEIVARVDDEVITRSELEEQLTFLTAQAPLSPEQLDSLRRQVLERMIDEKLLLIEARRDTTIKVTDEEVEQALENQIAFLEQQMGEEAFEAELKREGLTREQLKDRFRDQIREQLLIQKYVDKVVRPRVTVSPDEVRRFYEEKGDSIPEKPDMVRVRHILIRIRPDSAIEGRAKRQAEKLYAQIRSGRSFEDLAFRYSDDRETASQGGELGFVPLSTFPPAVAQKIAGATPGTVLEPVRGDRGYHIFKVEEIRGAAAHLKHILIEVKPTKEDSARALARAKKALAELREGASFAEVAEKYSDDTLSKDFGGDLGWLPITQFPESLQEILRSMKKGEIKGPVLSPLGYHILLLEDREPGGKPSFEEVREDIQQLLYQRKLQKELKKLTAQLREKIPVEVLL